MGFASCIPDSALVPIGFRAPLLIYTTSSPGSVKAVLYRTKLSTHRPDESYDPNRLAVLATLERNGLLWSGNAYSDVVPFIYYGRQRGPYGDAEAAAARIFPALDFLAALCTHIPNAGQQLVRYYGAFSNARRLSGRPSASASAPRAQPQPTPQDHSGSAEESAGGRRRSWARLIKKVYLADPLVCPRCSGPLKIISLIGDAPVIEKILRHLKLWHRPERPPPRPAARSIQYDDPIVDLDEPGDWPDASA